MVKPFPSKTHIGNHALHPETLMMNHGYDPQLSEGAVKPPVFLTSTFVFKTAEDGQDYFDFGSGRREPPEGMGAGLVYSRFNHPNSEIVEDRLSIYERTEKCALFSSGMSAIATTILAVVRPGDVILHSQPLNGGTETLLAKTLAGLSIGAVGFADGVDEAVVRAAAQEAMSKGPSVDDLHGDTRKSHQRPGGHSGPNAGAARITIVVITPRRKSGVHPPDEVWSIFWVGCGSQDSENDQLRSLMSDLGCWHQMDLSGWSDDVGS